MKVIFRWRADFGRMGDLSGIFVSTTEELAKLKGKRVVFGEVLGKHSDIDYSIKVKDFEIVSENAEEIAFFERLGLSNGFNPLEWRREQERERKEERKAAKAFEKEQKNKPFSDRLEDAMAEAKRRRRSGFE